MLPTRFTVISRKRVSEGRFHGGGDKVVHIHISENDRARPHRRDQLAREFRLRFASSGYDRLRLVIEAFGLAHARDPLRRRKFGRGMFTDEITLAPAMVGVHEICKSEKTRLNHSRLGTSRCVEIVEKAIDGLGHRTPG